MTIATLASNYDEVIPRDLHFEMTPENVTRHWFNGDPWTTHWMNAILAAVPDGERWVMNSARRQLSRLTHAGVKQEARAFIRQERIHAREHDEMNASCVAHGIPIDKCEAVFKVIRETFQHRLSDDMQSSVAAAFEHFTAIISSVMLDNPDMFDKTNPELRAMLYWHFVEETEHKGVSFDVFIDASGGGLRGYTLRTSGMVFATLVGLPILIGNQSYLLYKDKQLTNIKSAIKMGKTLFFNPGIMRKTLMGFFPYFRPGFHPWDDDNKEIINVWKRAFEQTGDTHEAFRRLHDHSLAQRVGTQESSNPLRQSA
jgi:predicted metal-dependent hydrolase|tara:strand:+ start:56833 stop:57771 length:939 start_codon:yes stop_codon:yes gene_type:complete